MKHYYLSFFIATLMSMAYTMASAHDIAVANSNGKTIYYVKNSNGRSVSVTYQGTSYSSYSNEYTGDVVIPETVTYGGKTYSVTSIGSSAFRDCSDLTSVTIPNSVTSISSYAFVSCSGLTSVTIPNSVTSIGDSAFYGTAWFDNQPDGLVYAGNVAYKYKGTMPANTSITLKEGTVGIASYAFLCFSGLTSVTIPNSVTSIGSYAFESCSGLTSVTWNAKNYPAFSSDSDNPFYNIRTQITEFIMGDEVTSIPAYMCYGMSNLKSIIIHNSVTSIGLDAFNGCSGLEKVIVPNFDIKNWCSIKFGNYSANPLYYAHHLYSDENTEITELIIPDDITSIGSYAFRSCSGLTSVTIPNSVTSIGSSAFNGCSGLTSVTIPNSVTSIGSYAFRSCSGLASVTIPNSVTSIGSSAFNGCSGLTSVTIPNSVTSIGLDAFDGCSGLTSVTWNAKNYPTFSSYIYSPFYQIRTKITEFIIGDEVTNIPTYMFYEMENLRSVTIGNSINTIELSTFSGCNNLSVLISKPVNPVQLTGDIGLKTSTKIVVPEESLDDYKKAWLEYYRPDVYTYLPIPSGGVMFTEKATLDNYTAAMQNIDKSTITSVCFYDSIDASLTVEKIQEGMNPNCLYYYYSDNALQGKNLVNLDGYSSEKIILSDANVFRCLIPFTAKKAQFTYTPSVWANGFGGWETLCLPFEVSAFKASESGYISPVLLGAYGDFWLRQFVGASSKALYFSSTLDGTMKANTPYLLAFPGSVMGSGHLQGQTITFLGKNVEFEANATAEVQRNDKVFVGNYDNVADDASGWILNSTGSDLIASSVVGDKPFRAYFRTEDDFEDFNAAKTLNISFVEDEETAIREINEDRDAENALNIYSIDGTLVRKAENISDSLKSLKKGTYIINHKKVMIR